jgi:hypothetical protein
MYGDLVTKIVEMRCTREDRNLVHLVLSENPGDAMQHFAKEIESRSPKNLVCCGDIHNGNLHAAAHQCMNEFSSTHFLLRLPSRIRKDRDKLIPFGNFAQNLRKGVVATTKPFGIKWLEKCPTVVVFSKTSCASSLDLSVLSAPHRWVVWTWSKKAWVQFPRAKQREYDWGDGAVPALLD